MEFTGAGARQAAAVGRIEQWVHSFMRGPGNNRPLSDGLASQNRWWIGPILVPVERLQRKVGPENDMPYRIPADVWEGGLPNYIRAIEAGWDVPPPVVEFIGTPELLAADGNHRIEALRILGRVQIEVVIWFNTESDRASFKPGWSPKAG